MIDQTHRLEKEAGGRGLHCTLKGLSLAGVPLLYKTATGWAARPADEITILFKGAYDLDSSPAGLLAGLDVIARADQILAKYDPGEPRDARRRWTTDDGARSSHSAPQRVTSPSAPSRAARPKSAFDEGATQAIEPRSSEAPGRAVSPDGLKPILVSNPGRSNALNDNEAPMELPNIVAYAFTKICMAHARDPTLWTKYWLDFFDRIRAGQNPGAPPIESYFQPPESPEGERPAVADPAFAADCRANIFAMTKGSVVWEAELFTYNERWGLVWRADFRQSNRKAQLYPTRVVYWRTDQGGPGTIISNRQNKKLEL